MIVVSQVPQMPSSHDVGGYTPRVSRARTMDCPGATSTLTPEVAATTSKAVSAQLSRCPGSDVNRSTTRLFAGQWAVAAAIALSSGSGPQQ